MARDPIPARSPKTPPASPPVAAPVAVPSGAFEALTWPMSWRASDAGMRTEISEYTKPAAVNFSTIRSVCARELVIQNTAVLDIISGIEVVGLGLTRGFDFELIVHGYLSGSASCEIVNFGFLYHVIHRTTKGYPATCCDNFDVLGGNAQNLVFHDGLSNGLGKFYVLGALGLIPGREGLVVLIPFVFPSIVGGRFIICCEDPNRTGDG